MSFSSDVKEELSRQYGRRRERRKNIEYIAYEDQITERALQTLNIDIISNSKTR